MNKKLLALLVALLLVASFATFSGCTSSGPAATTAPGTTTAPSATTEPTQQPTEQPTPTPTMAPPTPIIWYVSYASATKDADMVLKALNEYLINSINIQLDLRIVDGADIADKLNVMINAGEYYDMAFAASWLTFSQYARAGAFLSIGDLAQKVAPKLYSYIPEYLWEGTKVDGKNYMIPRFADAQCTQQWYLDKGLCDKYGIDLKSISGSLESFEPALATIKSKVDAGLEDCYIMNGGDNLLSYQYCNPLINLPVLGVDAITNETTVTCPLENPRIVSGFRTLRKYYVAGYIPKDAATITSLDPNKSVFLFYSTGFPLSGVAINPPVYQIQGDGGWVSTDQTVIGQAISINSKYPEQAIKMLDAVFFDEFVHNTLVLGLEGVHYTKTAPKHVTQTPEQAKLYGLSNWELGTFFGTLWTVNSEPENKWDVVYNWIKDEIYPLKIMGFNYDATNVQNEVSALTNVWAKYQNVLLTGTVDPDTVIPEILAQLKDAGLDTVKADMQAQIDKFLSSK